MLSRATPKTTTEAAALSAGKVNLSHNLAIASLDKAGRLDKLRGFMFSLLADKLQGVFRDLSGKGKISETNVTDALREVRMALLEADVHFQVAKDFISRVREKALGESVLQSITPGQQIVKVFHDELTTLLGGDASPLDLTPPARILMVGLNGSGKTTTCGKLANWLRKQGKAPVMIALDLYRPAAIEQLATLGRQLGVPVFVPPAGETNVLAAAKQSQAWLKETPHSVEIYDTAGRQEIDEALIAEVRQVKDFLQPQEVLLVADAATGQQAVSVATHFHEALDISGLVLTKLDGDARGGAALSIARGHEAADQIRRHRREDGRVRGFPPDRLAGRILGMGDVVTLVESAAAAIDEDEAKRMEERIRRAQFDFNDFLQQFKFMRRLGPLEKILGMLPPGDATLGVVWDGSSGGPNSSPSPSATATTRSSPGSNSPWMARNFS